MSTSPLEQPWDMSNVSVVILGAGFSFAATDGRMPLMSNYFADIEQTAFPLLCGFITAVSGDIKTANVETVLLALDQIRTSPKSVLAGWAEEWHDRHSELNEQLTQYTLQRLKVGLQFDTENWAANVLAQCGPETSVISMNYDNLAERILSNRKGTVHHRPDANCPHCKMRMLLERACNCVDRYSLDDEMWRGSLIKPHGSVAWRRCVNPECCSYECLVADERCRPFEPCLCPNCSHRCSPVMVMPTMSKNLGDLPEIGVMWQAARRALSYAESILVFGFSLPDSDELLTQMIRNSIQCEKRLKRLAVIDLYPEAVIERFKRCVPGECEVFATPFPVSGMEPPDWLIRPTAACETEAEDIPRIPDV
jgi:hypothetical protein